MKKQTGEVKMKTRNIIILAVIIGAFFWLLARPSQPEQLTSRGTPVAATVTEAEAYERSFITGCMEEDATLSLCQCIYDEFERLYTLEEQLIVAKEYEITNNFPPNLVDAAIMCGLKAY